MKFKGTIIGEASGSLASLTFSHNKGGQYIRQRAIPTNPNTLQQQAVRNQVAELTSRWNNILTDTQRDAWNLYAFNVPLVGPLGEPRNVSGMNMYVRSNVPRIQAGLARIDTGPIVFNLGEFTGPAIAGFTPATETVSVSFTNTDEWASEVGSSMLIYIGRPQNVSINFFKGPYRFAARINGAAVPPTSPQAIVSPFPFDIGQQVFLRATVTRVDGRLSGTFRTGQEVP